MSWSLELQNKTMTTQFESKAKFWREKTSDVSRVRDLVQSSVRLSNSSEAADAAMPWRDAQKSSPPP
jgi:hypothetical protein